MKNLELGFPHLIFDLSLIIQILEFIIHHIPDKRIKVSISIQQQLDFFYSALYGLKQFLNHFV